MTTTTNNNTATNNNILANKGGIAMMKTTNNNALVNETLTKDEVMSLLNETLERNHDTNDYLSILKGTFTAWSGEEYDGYIVCHHTKTATPETANDYMPTYVKRDDYYFMEVTLEEVDNPMGTSHLWEPTFHKLIPITENYIKPRLSETGDMKDLCNYIVDNACRDKWEYTLVPMSKEEIEQGKKRDWWWYTHYTTKVVPLTYNDIYCHWSTPLTEEEQKAKVKAEKESETNLIAMFSTGELPVAEDDAWYSVLSMGYGTTGYDLETKVINILKKRGFNVHIDGERDSFGWVTRGIFVDGEMMCLI